MIKLPTLDYYCDSNKFYFTIELGLYSINWHSNYENQTTYITFQKFRELFNRLGLSSKSIYIENDDYIIYWLFDKLTNEEILEIYIQNRFNSLKKLFSNLYLAEKQ